jgi:hypothetical protein
MTTGYQLAAPFSNDPNDPSRRQTPRNDGPAPDSLPTATVARVSVIVELWTSKETYVWQDHGVGFDAAGEMRPKVHDRRLVDFSR